MVMSLDKMGLPVHECAQGVPIRLQLVGRYEVDGGEEGMRVFHTLASPIGIFILGSFQVDDDGIRSILMGLCARELRSDAFRDARVCEGFDGFGRTKHADACGVLHEGVTKVKLRSERSSGYNSGISHGNSPFKGLKVIVSREVSAHSHQGSRPERSEGTACNREGEGGVFRGEFARSGTKCNERESQRKRPPPTLEGADAVGVYTSHPHSL
jgi:hypothetical protein